MAAAAAWNCGTLGIRRPASIPDTTLTLPSAAVEVTVERSSELLNPAESAKSKCLLGAIASSISAPALLALGTLKTTRDEHEPAVTVACRSLTSM